MSDMNNIEKILKSNHQETMKEFKALEREMAGLKSNHQETMKILNSNHQDTMKRFMDLEDDLKKFSR